MEEAQTGILDSFLDSVSGFFQSFFDWVLDFIFSGFDSLSNIGQNVSNKLFSLISGHVNSSDFLYFFLGSIVVVFVLKLFIHVVRG